jgi:hypothetical protein
VFVEAVPAGELHHLTASNKVLVTHTARLTSNTKHTGSRLLLLLLLWCCLRRLLCSY